ncbi:MAG: hypothetical protein ACI4D8_04670 [Wujia sp.]
MERKREGFLSKVWKWVGTAWLVMIIIEGLCFKAQYKEFNPITFLAWGMVIIQLVIVVGIELLRRSYTDRCPHCGKWHALNKAGKEYVGSKDISVLTELNSYNNRHLKTGTHEQYIGGTRKFYHKNYECKYCHKTCYIKYSIDYKNV